MEKRQHTKDKLAAALRGVGLEEMAVKAESGYYHDFLSPLELPEIILVNNLAQAGIAETDPDKQAAIFKLRQDVINGDYDASEEESEEWAKSEEGQATFRKLTGH